MCYDDKARPPIPPGDTVPAFGEDIVLTASDGNRFSAYFASPGTPSIAQVIVYPDVRGLHQFYKELALRFAEVGIAALAIDYFGRTAGLTSRAEPFDFMPHVKQVEYATFTRDVSAALQYLKDRAGGAKPTFVIGFCMGGSFTLATGTNSDFSFAGLIPFYAGITRTFGDMGTILDLAHNVKYPVMGIFGGADTGIPEDKVKALDEELDVAGVEHEIRVYEGAPHSFFDRNADQFADASADAWRRVLEFITRLSK
jgi:carboxymethylenebutenolidase